MIAAVLTVVLLATPAPSDVASRVHFARAQKAFAQHDWRRALDEFTAASETAPDELPDLWFDIAQCHRNLGHARLAVAAFERYLTLRPDAPDREKVRTLIVSLGGKLPPVEEPAPVTPAVVAAPEEAAPATVDARPAVTLAATTTPTSSTTSLPLIAASDAPPPPKAHRHWKVWTGVAVGVAAAALGVGLGVGLGMQPHASTSTMAMAPSPSLGTGVTFDTRGH